MKARYSIDLALKLCSLQEHLLIAERSSDTQAGTADTPADVQQSCMINVQALPHVLAWMSSTQHSQ